jgi:23S rRNA (adenine2503-C2)-methyltransferase
MEYAVITRKSRVESSVDRTVKLTYTSTRVQSSPVHLEIAWVDKQDGKVILCVPTQSNCAMACTFCHTTGMSGKVAVSDLTSHEMVTAIQMAYEEQIQSIINPAPVLISFMGCGEPMNNWRNVVMAMSLLRTWAMKVKIPIRFAIATMLPATKIEEFTEFANYVKKLLHNVTVHLSLHFVNDLQRKRWMPAAAPITLSVNLLKWYSERTGNPVEIHYTLIAAENDSLMDAWGIENLLSGTNIPIKVLHFAPKEGETHQSPPAEWQKFLKEYLERAGVPVELYSPPGADIEAACGQFTVSDYIETADAGLVQLEVQA